MPSERSRDALQPAASFEPAAVGQVVEWLAWSHLVSSSRGALRVFLPTRDMGVDGIVHRPSTDAFVAVQVKGRSRLDDGVLRIHVQEEEADDPRTVVLAFLVDLDNNTLHDPALVMTVAQLREHAHLIQWGPRLAYAVSVPYPPGSRTHWRDVCVPLAEVAQRICPGPAEDVAPALVEPFAADQEDLATTGFIGELALLHYTSLSPVLNTFHAAPDRGFDEYLVRHVGTGGVAGFQVKCIEVDENAPAGIIHLPVRTLTTSAHAWLAVFVRGPPSDITSPCLLIPARVLPDLAHKVTDGYLHITINPRRLGRLAAYAQSLDDLPAQLERIAAAPVRGR